MNKLDDILTLAKELRKSQTGSERLLLVELRKRQFFGHKFLRQHPILYNRKFNTADFYVADFYCAKLSLVIEVDGNIHLHQKEYDTGRDELLKELGYHVIRFTNAEVEKDIFTVLKKIEEQLK